MSQLPNAPLVELVFRIRWHIRNQDEISSIQYLLGDFYNQVVEDFPIRSRIEGHELPFELHFNSTSHKFSPKGVKFPNIQLGANTMAITCTDEYYNWEEFRETTISVTSKLIRILHGLIKPHHYHLHLEYIDFYPLNFEVENILDFLSTKLKIKFQQDFHKTDSFPNEFDISFEYPVECGTLSVFSSKERLNHKDGIIVNTGAESDIVPPEIKAISNWINKAHDLCSKTFKNMTSGDLYKSFE